MKFGDFGFIYLCDYMGYCAIRVGAINIKIYNVVQYFEVFCMCTAKEEYDFIRRDYAYRKVLTCKQSPGV